MTQLMPLHPLTPLLIDNYPWEWFSVSKQVLQVAKWEGSVALVLTHYDPALTVYNMLTNINRDSPGEKFVRSTSVHRHSMW